MLQGLRKPVNDLSRRASVDDIVSTIALTANHASQTTAAPGQQAGRGVAMISADWQVVCPPTPSRQRGCGLLSGR